MLISKKADFFKHTSLGRAVLNMLIISNYTNWATLPVPLDPNMDIDKMTNRAGRKAIRAASWVSPLFWLYSEPLFMEKFHSTCDDLLWRLINLAHALVELVFSTVLESSTNLTETAARYEALRLALESLPMGKVLDKSNFDTIQVHRYECCRLTALLMLRFALHGGVSWYDATTGTTYVEDVVQSLSNSGPEDLWGEHVGLCYWVGHIVRAVMHWTPYRLFATGLVHRLIAESALGDSDPRIGAQSLRRLAEFEERCISGVPRGPVSPTSSTMS